MNTTKLKTASILIVAGLTVLGAPQTRAGDPHLAPGKQRRWAIDFQVQLEQPGRERPIEIDLRGDWVSTVSAVRTGQYDLALELENAYLKGGGSGHTTRQAWEQTQRRLARPFWATYRDTGELLAVHFLKDVDPSDRNLLQMIATESQLVRSYPGRPVWNVLERDGAGSYLAIYQQTEPRAVVKRKVKYVQTDGLAGAPADALYVHVDQSKLRFSLDSEGGVVGMEGSERVRMGVPSGQAEPLVALTTIRLSNLRTSQAPELVGSLARAGLDVESSPIVTHKPDPEQVSALRDARLLEGHSTGSLLEAAMSEEKNDRELPQRLAALFRRRPEAAPVAVGMLRKSGARERITDALGAAGSPAAIQALDELARDRTTPTPLRIEALSALVLVQRPSLEAMRIPAALLDDQDARLASAARIMGGAVARAGRKEHPAEAAALDAALIARYRKAREVREVRDLLDGLGNSVGPSALPVIESALRDSREPVREAAARALRLAEAPEIDGLLSETITGDRDPEVRAAAIFATSFRRPTDPLTEALMQAAKADAVEHVRADAITQLRARSEAYPRISATLAWIAEHDAKPGIRRLAREGLGATSQQR